MRNWGVACLRGPRRGTREWGPANRKVNSLAAGCKEKPAKDMELMDDVCRCAYPLDVSRGGGHRRNRSWVYRRARCVFQV